jgi:hypothetical protein
MNLRLFGVILAATATVGLLGGCAGSPTDLSDAAATSMQSDVRKVADAAASGNYASAATQLDALQNRLTAATASNEVSASRALQIQASINLVKADLAALTAPPSPSPSPTPSPTAPGKDKGHKPGNGDKSGGGNDD